MSWPWSPRVAGSGRGRRSSDSSRCSRTTSGSSSAAVSSRRSARARASRPGATSSRPSGRPWRSLSSRCAAKPRTPGRARPGRTCGPGRRSRAPSSPRAPGAFSLQLLVGAGVPLLVLGAAGLARYEPARTTLVALALGSSAVVATRVVLSDDPNWFVPRERMATALALRDLCEPGDLLLGPPDVEQYAIGLSRCHALFAHPATPGYEARLSEARAFYATWSPAERSAWLDRQGVTHLVLPGDAGPLPAGWLGAATPFRRVARVGAGRTSSGSTRGLARRGPSVLTCSADERARLRPDPLSRAVVRRARARGGPRGARGAGRGRRPRQPARRVAPGRADGRPAGAAHDLGHPRPRARPARPGLGAGQEVICPSFTFVSSANAVLRVGARPVFAEIEDTTLGLDSADVERRITPRTAAILPVHYAGVAPDMEAILDLARRRPCSWSRTPRRASPPPIAATPSARWATPAASASTRPRTSRAGRAGRCVLADPEVARRAEIAREKGTNRAAFFRGEVDKYTWVAEGSSYVLSDLLAAVLLAQLEKRDAIQARRASVAARYRQGLAGWATQRGVRLPPRARTGRRTTISSTCSTRTRGGATRR